VTTRQTAMQLDLTDLTETTDQTIALPQALLRQTNWTTRRTRTLIQALIGTDDNRRCEADFFDDKATEDTHTSTLYCNFLSTTFTGTLYCNRFSLLLVLN